MGNLFNSGRLMLSIVSKVRDDYKKLFPEDVLNYRKITEIMHSVAWKIKEKEGSDENHAE